MKPHNDGSDITLYPNPTTGVVHIESSNYEENMNYTILNAFGQCLDAGVLQSNMLSLEKLPSGIYFVQLSSGNQPIVTKKIIKQ